MSKRLSLTELDFTEVIVVNPAHVKALRGHKTDARDCARIAEVLECGLLRASLRRAGARLGATPPGLSALTWACAGRAAM